MNETEKLYKEIVFEVREYIENNCKTSCFMCSSPNLKSASFCKLAQIYKITEKIKEQA